MAGNPLVFRTLISLLVGMEMDIALIIRELERYIYIVEGRRYIQHRLRFEGSLVSGVPQRTTHLDAIQAPLMGHSLEIENKKEKKGDSFGPPFFIMRRID